LKAVGAIGRTGLGAAVNTPKESSEKKNQQGNRFHIFNQKPM
jgi:hypothetical protein